jgi:hypothetical protein
MADRWLQGTINHATFPLVDATDFASPESNLSAATKMYIYGKLLGNSALFFVNSGTGSLAGHDLIHVGASNFGLYTIALGTNALSDASAIFYDQYIFIASATGAANQIMIYSGVRASLSDILSTMNSQFGVVSNYLSNASNYLSNLSALLSDVDSALTSQFTNQSNFFSNISNYLSNLSGLSSDAHSAAAQANSRILVVQSNVSAMSAFLSDAISDLQSDLRSILLVTGVSLTSDTMSNLRSAITAAGGAGATPSAIWAYGYSNLTDVSTIGSALLARLSTISATNALASDILSTMGSQFAALSDAVSNAYSAAVVGASRVFLVQSRLSDLDSRLASEFSDLYSQVSDFRSDLASLVTVTGVHLNASTMSDLRSAIAGVTATLSVSDISDIGSRVAAVLASDLSDLLSGVRATQSLTSDTYSLLTSRVPDITTSGSDLVSAIWAHAVASDLISKVSDLRSHVITTGVPLDASTMSDIRSAILAGVGAVTVSNISDIVSAVRVDLASDLSDLLSRTTQINSRVLVTQSLASDVDSALTSRFSDLLSLLTTTGIQLNASSLSDVRSAITAGAGAVTVSNISDIVSAVRIELASDLSDLLSRTTQIHSRVSDLNSDLRSLITSASWMSDMASQVWAVALATKLVQLNPSDLSDLRSAIAGVTATLSVSDISDIASRVQAVLASDLSDLLSRTTEINSRVLVGQSWLSDIYSLASDLNSDLRSLITGTGVQLNASSLSDLRSAIAGVTAAVSASDMSDIASRVQALLASDLSDLMSRTTQINSRVSDLNSDLRSLITLTGITLDASTMSDLRSAVLSLSAMLSDAHSAATLAASRALVTQSLTSDVDSALTSRFSDLMSLITTTGVQLNASSLSDLRSAITAGPTAPVTASDISDIASAVWAHAIGTRVDSRILLNQSRISDLQSYLVALSDQMSDLNSDLRSLVTTTGIQLNASSLSDLRSAITAAGGGTGATASQVWTYVAGERTLTASGASDIASHVWAHAVGTRLDSRVLLNLSRVSDVYSLLSDTYSDLRSLIVALSDQVSDLNSDLRSLMTVTGVQLNASTMSDLRSAITAGGDPSVLSDILSAAQQTNSRALRIMSDTSDLVSRTATYMSDMSDVLSRTTQLNSRVLVTQSQASDLYSLLQGLSGMVSDVDSALTSQFSYERAVLSDLDSRVPARVLTRTDTMVELPQATPPATPTQEQALMLMYAGLRGKTRTNATHRAWYNDAGTMIVRKPIQASAGSFLESEMIAGV